MLPPRSCYSLDKENYGQTAYFFLYFKIHIMQTFSKIYICTAFPSQTVQYQENIGSPDNHFGHLASFLG